MEGKLTRKQELFCVEYINCNGNGSEACRRAGYTGKSDVTSARLLVNVKIRNKIAELTAKADKKRMATKDDILAFWAEVMNKADEKTADRLKASQLLSEYWNLAGDGAKEKTEVADKLAEVEFVVVDGGKDD